MRLLKIIGICFVAASLSGCGTKLEMSSSFNLAMGENKEFYLDPIKNEQKIKITGTVEGSPVNVLVFLKKNDNSARIEIMKKKYTQIILAKQEKTDSINLESIIPANEEAIVYVESAGKTAKVQLNITNK